MAKDRWYRVAFPILEYVYENAARDDRLSIGRIAAGTGLDPDDVSIELESLCEAGYLAGELRKYIGSSSSSWTLFGGALRERGLRAVDAWPTDSPSEPLIELIEPLIELIEPLTELIERQTDLIERQTELMIRHQIAATSHERAPSKHTALRGSRTVSAPLVSAHRSAENHMLGCDIVSGNPSARVVRATLRGGPVVRHRPPRRVSKGR